MKRVVVSTQRRQRRQQPRQTTTTTLEEAVRKRCIHSVLENQQRLPKQQQLQLRLLRTEKHRFSQLVTRNHACRQRLEQYPSKQDLHHQTRRFLSSNPPPPSSNHVVHGAAETSSSSSDWGWIPPMLARLLAGFGMVHVVGEYGLELNLCEGPSMYPTILPHNEIILVDKLTPRIWGIQGGCVGEERREQARQRQEAFQEKQQQQQQQEKKKDCGGVEVCWHQKVIAVNELPNPYFGVSWVRLWQRCLTPVSVGDVVVVQHPNRNGTVCKRVLGLPGDVVLRPASSRWRRNDEANERFLDNRRRRRHRPSYRWVDGVDEDEDDNEGYYRSQPKRTRRPPPVLLVVPDGHLWLEGDNSVNSSDSRNYGPIPANHICGRVLFRVWPLRGNAMIERGGRPMPPPNQVFTGYTVLPAGYEGETIVKK